MENWEDWDNEDNYCLPNEEQLKLLEERKLVEESDNALTKVLFGDEEKIINSCQNKNFKKEPKKNLISKQRENEQKQKEFSRLAKEYKAKKERERELFGQATENAYSQYEEMFY